MFELTGSLEFIVPTMVAVSNFNNFTNLKVMFAKWVGDAVYPHVSFFLLVIKIYFRVFTMHILN